MRVKKIIVLPLSSLWIIFNRKGSLSLFLKKILLFIFRESGREGEREEEKHWHEKH